MLLLRSCARLMETVPSDRANQSDADDPERSAARRRRDEALGRVVRVRRGVIAGAAALTAGAAALASAAVPGHSLSAHRASRAGASVKAKTPSPSTSPRMPPLAPPSQLGLGASGNVTPQAPTPPAPTPQATTPPAAAPQPPAAPPQAAPSGGGAVVSGGS